MKELARLQKSMLRAVFAQGRNVPGVTSEALELYRDLTRTALQETLNAVYSKTREYFGIKNRERAWVKICEKFIDECRPQDFRLNWAVESFPEKLPGSAWLKELADFEWARYLAVSAPDADQVKPSRDIHPSVVLRAYRYPVPQWFQNPIESAPKVLPRGGVLHAVIFRDPQSDRIRTLELHPLTFELLSAWRESPGKAKSVISRLKIENQLGPVIRKFQSEGIVCSEAGLHSV